VKEIQYLSTLTETGLRRLRAFRRRFGHERSGCDTGARQLPVTGRLAAGLIQYPLECKAKAGFAHCFC
jgi:hypothetical protein